LKTDRAATAYQKYKIPGITRDPVDQSLQNYTQGRKKSLYFINQLGKIVKVQFSLVHIMDH
jgi:hypothetical protein